MKPVARRAFRWFGPQTSQLAVAQIDPVHFALLALGIKRVVIGRVEQNIKTVAAGERGPIRIANQLFALPTGWPNPVLVVLQAAGDSEIRFRIVKANSVKFSRRNLAQVVPVFPAGKTLIQAAVGPEQQTLTNRRLRRFVFVFRLGRLGRRGRARLNGQGVAIRMHFLGKIFPEIFAAIIRDKQRELEQINTLIVRGIDPDLTEIKWPRIDPAHSRPMLAVVFRSKDAAAFAAQIAQSARTAFKTLPNGHHDSRITRAHRQTDSTSLRGQTAAQFFPARAAISTFENSTDVFTAGRLGSGSETPRCALPGVKRCVNNLRIAWIENHIAAARARVVRRGRLENQLPCFAAVSCFVKAALATVRP